MNDRDFSNRLQAAINDFDIHVGSNGSGYGGGDYSSSGHFTSEANKGYAYNNDNNENAYDDYGNH